uniref:Cytochrome c6 n=1 Tax=Hydropuntia rangiferina TaxID=338881 RepID=A0A345U858_9FLOR|nr:cytochrome c553 [Hydropuntia rangiferina]AXI96644.1 cytochrome c553 [Hydropuntia rangiferina]UAD87327.1 cytochrome c553 [Hydropuntia rangiferina]
MRLLFSFFIICSILINNIHSTFAADLDAGEQIFSANCSACHANGNNAIMPNKTLKNEDLLKYDMKSITAITNQVKNGKNAMPAFGGRLSDDDIDNVANYVLSQSENGW